MNSRHRCAKTAYLMILLSVWSGAVWGMDELQRAICREVMASGAPEEIARGLRQKLRIESIDTAGDLMIALLQASNFQVDPANPRPRPEIDRPEIRALWEEVIQGRLAHRSIYIQRMNEAEIRRLEQEKQNQEGDLRLGGQALREQQGVVQERNLLTIGRLIPKIISTQFREIPKGVYYIGEKGKGKGMWVRVKSTLFAQRGLVSRAQFKKVMGFDSVTRWWQEQSQEERQRHTQARDEWWRQATQIPEEELGNYPATLVSAEQADEYGQSLGGDFRLPTEWEQMVFMHAGREGNIPEQEQRKKIIYHGNAGGRLHETGEMESNPWDVHNALGNAWQWSGSTWMPFTYPETAKENPIDIDELAKRNPQTGSYRVFRGGGWDYNASYSQPGLRHGYGSAFRNYGLGFRVLRTVEE